MMGRVQLFLCRDAAGATKRGRTTTAGGGRCVVGRPRSNRLMARSSASGSLGHTHADTPPASRHAKDSSEKQTERGSPFLSPLAFGRATLLDQPSPLLDPSLLDAQRERARESGRATTA